MLAKSPKKMKSKKVARRKSSKLVPRRGGNVEKVDAKTGCCANRRIAAKGAGQSKSVAVRPAAFLPSVPQAMQALDRIELEIANAKTLDVVKKAADAAAGLQLMFKPVREVANRAGLAWMAALRRIDADLKQGAESEGRRTASQAAEHWYQNGPSAYPPRTWPQQKAGCPGAEGWRIDAGQAEQARGRA
jgi:hypothetical protein